MFDTNRRKYPRVDCPCQLTVRLVGGFSETISSKTKNIGLGGLCVHLDRNIEVGSKVEIQLQLPSTTTPFKCQGVVVRSQPEIEGYYNTGIEFEPLSDLKHAFLDGKIAEIIDSEQKGKS